MNHAVVHVCNRNVSKYGGAVIDRAIAFNSRYGLKADPEILMALLTNEMFAPEPQTLVQAAVTEDGRLVGHCITLLQELFGDRTAMVYQLEIDEGDHDNNREEMLRSGWDQISAWADHHGCRSIRAWAMNPKLAEVFHRFGLENKDYQFLEIEL